MTLTQWAAAQSPLVAYLHKSSGSGSSARTNCPRRPVSVGLGMIADADCPAQRPRVDQDRNHSLRHADHRQQQKFRIVE
jgi:hypothetical protein